MNDHATNVKGAFDLLANILQKYEYFTDIVALAKQNTFNGLTEAVGSQNLASEIFFLKNNVAPHASMRDVWNRDMILFEANNASRDFGNYLTETLPRLKQKRNEIESAEVSPDRLLMLMLPRSNLPETIADYRRQPP